MDGPLNEPPSVLLCCAIREDRRADPQRRPKMTFSAWIYLIAVWTVVVVISAYCITRIFKKND